jgi:hypothetical protein
MPQVIDTATLRMGASTEKIPFTPQAHGTNGRAESFKRSSPEGKNVPRQTPMGSTSTNTRATRAAKGRPTRLDRRGRTSRCSAMTTAASG